MKLPDIEYGTPVARSDGTAAAPFEAAAGLSKTLAAGLQAYGQELVKNQVQEAGVSLAERLNAVEQGLKARKYVSAREIRDVFGEDVPEQARAAMQVRTDAGELVDNDQIPTWLVGDSLYRKAAEKALQAAGQGIHASGWRSDFQVRAQEHVEQRRARLADYHLRELDSYLQASQAHQVQRLANAGDYAGAREAVAGATALQLEDRQKLLVAVQRAEDLAPLEAGIRGKDFATTDALIKGLEDKARFTTLTDHERTVYAERLRGARERGAKDFARWAVDAAFQQHPHDEAARLAFVRENVKDPETYGFAFASVKAEGDARRTAALGTVGASLWTSGKLDRSSDAYRSLDDEGRAKAEAQALDYQQRLENLSLARQSRTDKEVLGWFSTLTPAEKAQANVAGEVLQRGGSVAAYNAALVEQSQAAQVVRKGLQVPEALFKDTVLGELVKVEGFSGTGKKTKAKRDAVVLAMDAWRSKYFSEKQAYPMRAEVLAELSRQVSDAEVPGRFYGTNTKKVYQAERAGEAVIPGSERPPKGVEQPGPPRPEPARPAARKLEDIPPVWQERIRRDWKVRNPTLSKVPDHAIVDGYNRAHAAGLVKEDE